MTDLPDWAKDRAREWLNRELHPLGPEVLVPSLAALLVEVDQVAGSRIIRTSEWNRVVRADVLAEVRRVVEEQIGKWESHSVAPIALRDVLAWLDALK